MAKLIALRRQSQTSALGLKELSFEGRRSHIVEEAETSDRSDALQSIGIRESSVDKPVPADESSFERWGYVGAYVVDAQSDEMREKAIEVLDDEYIVIPNVEMGLPQPMITQEYRRRPYHDHYWPIDSGVKIARDNGITGKGVLVGVLDTGCDADHLELRHKRIDFRYVPLSRPSAQNIRPTRGFDMAGHGTHVCGIIAGKNVGVAPDAELMVASVIESETIMTSLERIVVALDWMLSQFKLEENLTKPIVINMSLGFLEQWISGATVVSIMDGVKAILTMLVDDFAVLPVVAIGNDGPGIMRTPGFFPQTLSVGAVDEEQEPASFSGGGISPLTGDTEPNLVGYGVDVLSSLERNIENRSLYATMDGTSMATPYVVGIAALYAEAYPGLQGMALRQKLMDEALIINKPPNRVGAGLARFV